MILNVLPFIVCKRLSCVPKKNKCLCLLRHKKKYKINSLYKLYLRLYLPSLLFNVELMEDKTTWPTGREWPLNTYIFLSTYLNFQLHKTCLWHFYLLCWMKFGEIRNRKQKSIPVQYSFSYKNLSLNFKSHCLNLIFSLKWFK